MKKIIVALSALMVLTTGISATAFAACEEYDFNGDGVVNSMDISILIKYMVTEGSAKPIEINDEFDKYLESIELSDEAIDRIKEFGDINSDGNINGDDCNALINKFFEQGVYVTDVNKDGKLDAFDPQLVSNYYASIMVEKKDEYTAEEIEFLTANCDYNGDGSVNTLDASYLMSYISDGWKKTYSNGDANLDGAVDALDASIILDYYSCKQANIHVDEDKEIGMFKAIKCMGDINDDGSVDAIDASIVLSDYAKNQTK